MYKLYNILSELFVKEALSPEEIFKAVIDPETGKKYKNSTEFREKNRPAWNAADKLDMLDDLYPDRQKNPDRAKPFSREEIEQAVIDPKTGKRYTSIDKFREENWQMYRAASRRNMLKILFPETKEAEDWTPEEVKQAAIDPKTGKIYTSRTEFRDSIRKAYDAAHLLGMMDKLIPNKGEISKKFIYAFEFWDNQTPVAVYVGLTSNIETRKKEHTSGITRFNVEEDTSVTKFIKTYPDLKYKFKQLTSEPLDAGYTKEEQPNSPAGKAEREWEEKYKNEGWGVINEKPTGKDFGVSYKETRKELLKKALKYKSWSDLSNNNSPLYRRIIERDKIYSGFKDQVKQAIENKYKKYNQKQQERIDQKLLDQALKYKSWNDLRKAGMPPQSNPRYYSSPLYQKIYKRNQKFPGLMDKIKQAFETQRLQELAGITEIKIRPKGMGSKYLIIQRDSDQGDFIYFDDDEIEKYLKSVIDPEYIDEVDYFMNDENIGWDISSFSYLSKYDDDDDGNFEISNFLKVTDREIEDYAEQEMSYYLFSRPNEFPYKD